MDPRELEAYLDRVLIGDSEPGPVVLVERDPAWPARFERERARICQALGGVAQRVEHIGSTAVPGLAAKPIVDMLVTVRDIDDGSAFVGRLDAPGTCCAFASFASPAIACSAHRLSVHIHVLGDGDQEADRYMTFRDRLRASPADRTAYERLKRELATREWQEIGLYADANGPLIETILARAHQPRT